MHSGAKYNKGLGLLLLPLLVLLFASCENDLNKVREISSTEKGIVVDRKTGVDLIMSDSTKVKLHLTSPLVLTYNTKKPYDLMPKGVKIVLYEDGKEMATIVADTGIQHTIEKLVEFRKNVVITNTKGETFKSDELFWNQVTKRVYSHKPVQIVMEGGNVMNGVDFESDDKFLQKKFGQATGVFHVDENAVQ